MSVVLVVGSSGSGKRTLIQGLLRLLESHDKHQQLSFRGGGAASGEQDGSAAAASTVMRTPDRRVLIEQAEAEFDAYKAFIKTKYYNTEVTLWRQASALSILALRSVNLEGLEGIVVVFDLREDSSLAEGQQWATLVDHTDEDVAFRLCVGTKVDLLPENAGDDGSKDLQERRRRCVEWCLDHGFEFVEADCLNPEEGRDLREKEGVPRVVEAFQSNVWKGMEFQTDSRPSNFAAPARGRGILNTSSGSIREGGYGKVDVECDIHESKGEAEDDKRVVVSEHFQGFLEPNRSGDSDDDYGYNALGDDEDDGEQQHEQSVGEPSSLFGDVKFESPGGFGIEGEAGEEACHEMVALRQGSEELLGDGRRLRGSGIEPGHVELQAKWEVSEETPTSTYAADNLTGMALSSTEAETENNSVQGGETPSESGDGKKASPDFSRPDSQGQEERRARDGNGVTVREGVHGREEEKSGAHLDTEGGSFLRRRGTEDEMELLMGEVLKARELGDTVSDEERRARAANVAMRLAAMLGEYDGSSSDYDD